MTFCLLPQPPFTLKATVSLFCLVSVTIVTWKLRSTIKTISLDDVASSLDDHLNTGNRFLTLTSLAPSDDITTESLEFIQNQLNTKLHEKFGDIDNNEINKIATELFPIQLKKSSKTLLQILAVLLVASTVMFALRISHSGCTTTACINKNILSHLEELRKLLEDPALSKETKDSMAKLANSIEENGLLSDETEDALNELDELLEELGDDPALDNLKQTLDDIKQNRNDAKKQEEKKQEQKNQQNSEQNQDNKKQDDQKQDGQKQESKDNPKGGNGKQDSKDKNQNGQGKDDKGPGQGQKDGQQDGQDKQDQGQEGQQQNKDGQQDEQDQNGHGQGQGGQGQDKSDGEQNNNEQDKQNNGEKDNNQNGQGGEQQNQQGNDDKNNPSDDKNDTSEKKDSQGGQNNQQNKQDDPKQPQNNDNNEGSKTIDKTDKEGEDRPETKTPEPQKEPPLGRPKKHADKLPKPSDTAPRFSDSTGGGDDLSLKGKKLIDTEVQQDGQQILNNIGKEENKRYVNKKEATVKTVLQDGEFEKADANATREKQPIPVEYQWIVE